MLREGYARLGRIAYKAVSPFMRLYMTQKHLRVRILLVNEFDEVLLVRSWLGHQSWSLPGGGIRRNETPLHAVIRELQEETGLKLSASAIQELGSFPNPYAAAPFTIACFVAKTTKQEPTLARHRRLEVLDSAWFAIGRLPHDLSPTVKKALALRAGKTLV
jgi:8-oxo-dGTP pyrophosphatase MutT (NUDIX family)